MRAENPGDLEIQRVFGGRVAVFVLILGAESQELTPVPGDVRRDAPHLLRVGERVLGPVEAHAGVPVAVELLLEKQVRAERVLRVGARGIDVGKVS